MIAKMTQYSFILLHGDKENFLTGLQQLGVVDITRSAKPVDSYSQGILDNIETVRRDIECTEKGMDDTLAELLAERNTLLQEIQDVTPWGEYDRDRTVFGPLIIILSQTVQFGGISFTGPLISSSYSLSKCFICCAVIVMINLLITKFK